MNQGRRLQRLPRLLVGQLRRGQLAQLLIHQREKLLDGGGIPGVDLQKNTSDVAHRSVNISGERVGAKAP
jgi:hypothetical protein